MELQGETGGEWVEQKAPVIERMFQFWPGDRVNRVTSALGEGGWTLQARGVLVVKPFYK